MDTITFQMQDLGTIDYAAAYKIQQRMVQQVIDGEGFHLLLCEHPSVLTLGRLGKEEYILASEKELNEKGVDVHRIDRGGEVTLHSPGQLVIYPIVNLNHYERNLKGYLKKLEQISIELLSQFGISAQSMPGERGVWVDEKKIVSIGIGVKKWVTYHGMAINVNTDLNLYKMIKPCGLDVTMTSMADLKGKKFEINEIKLRVVDLFEKCF